MCRFAFALLIAVRGTRNKFVDVWFTMIAVAGAELPLPTTADLPDTKIRDCALTIPKSIITINKKRQERMIVIHMKIIPLFKKCNPL